MFFLISKLLTFLLMPIVWVLAALTLALLARSARRRPQWLRAGIGLLLLLTNPLLANQAWLAWEMPPVPVDQIGKHDIAIVLSGVIDIDKSPRDRVYMGRGADRVLHTVMLWRRGCFSRILITGGSGSVLDHGRLSEAAELRQVFRNCGVPDSVILTEEQSRNTRENALNSAAIRQRHPAWRRVVLITSAFHMRRAVGCFERVGIQATPFPVDYTGANQAYDPASLVLPTESALANWNRLIHEITGYLIYRAVGYC